MYQVRYKLPWPVLFYRHTLPGPGRAETVTGVFSTDGTRDGTRLVAATPGKTGNFTLFEDKVAFIAGSELGP